MRQRPFFTTSSLVLVIAVLLLFSGCTTRNGGETPTLQGTGQDLPVTRQTLPGTAGTMPTGLYQDIEDVKETLFALSEEWQPTGLTCAASSCTGAFVDTKGNTVTIRAVLYPGVDAAKAGFQAEKQKGSGYRQAAPPQAGDESYAWQHLTTAEIGVRKSNLVAVFDYTLASGAASAGEIRELVTIATDRL